MIDRRQRFRQQLAALEAAGSPLAAIDAGYYVPRPTSSERTSKRIELEPLATRVITGPIGSGKSTELFVMAEALKQGGDLWPVVVDVSLVHDLAELREGSLIAAAGIWLLEKAGLDNKPLRKLRELGYGTIETLKGLLSGVTISVGGVSTVPVARPAILQPPGVGGSLAWALAQTLHEALAEELAGRTPILLFDSIDRVRDTESFRVVLEQDAAALVQHGFGVVLTAPIDTVWRHADVLRTVTKSWDTLPYEDPREQPEAFAFLLEVLQRRIVDGLISDGIARELVDTSGGVLRDLIELARNAVEEAYMNGHDTVTQDDAAASIKRFARGLSLGLDNAAMAVLRSVHERRTIPRLDESTLRLLENRQILEHSAVDSYFEVHPVLQPMIERWAAAS